MYEVLIEAYELVGLECKERLVGDALKAYVSTGLLGGEDKSFAVDWSKKQVEYAVEQAINQGCKSNVASWYVQEALEKINLDAKFLFFFENLDGDYVKWDFRITVKKVN